MDSAESKPPAPSKQPGESPGLDSLDPLAHRTRRLDLTASLLAAGVLAVLEMGGAIAKKGFEASDLEVRFYP